MDNTVYTSEFTNWQENVNKLLHGADLAHALSSYNKVLIKPNLVEALTPPITTPCDFIAAIIDYLQIHCSHDLEIIIGEGCGSLDYDTDYVFDYLGYNQLADRKGVILCDLNKEPCGHYQKSCCRRFPDIYLPELLFDSYLISVPVLKAHTLAEVTLTMKNMMGVAPPDHYQGEGSWKKSSFHNNVHAAVFDLNKYRTPDFTILDATIGMQEAHLWGPHCNPPTNIIAASYDSVAIDAYGAQLLGKDWQRIGHIAMADGVIGTAIPCEVIYL